MIEIINNNYEYIIRLLIAGFCGVIIGYERTSKHKEAGIRTHVIVCMSAALMMLISKYGFSDSERFDGSRIAAQIVSGVGFLGAGIIFVKDRVTVSGLTTAAGIWGTAGVGMAVAAGLYTLGIISSIFIVFSNYFLKSTFSNLRDQKTLAIEIELENDIFDLDRFLEYNHLRLISINSFAQDEHKKLRLKANYFVDEFDMNKLMDSLKKEELVLQYKISVIS